MESVVKTGKKTLQSLKSKSPLKSLSVKNITKSVKSMESLKFDKIYENNMSNNLALIIFVLLIIGYISNNQFNAILVLFIFAIATYVIFNNLFYALLGSIVLTNLFLVLSDNSNTNLLTQEGLKEGKKNNEEQAKQEAQSNLF